jgi:energy-converting hydrogenase B subunit D
MNALIVITFLLVAVTGTAVVGTAEPERQAVTMSVFGLCLALLFVLLHAPDVALSQLAVGAALIPLMVMLTIRKIRRDR